MSKFLFLDGNSLLFRAYFAVPVEMSNTSGQATNAVYGFTSMLVTLLERERPDGLVVAFDRAEPTFRHEMEKEYKGGRDETPELLISQFPFVVEVIKRMGAMSIDMAGYEADDILATLARIASEEGHHAIVVSGDRDVFSLVSDPYVQVLYNRRGVTDYSMYNEAGILERCGVTPGQYVEFAAMRGDPSDNLVGIPGVGEKTAARLINKYGSLDAVLAAANEQTPKLKENLNNYKDNALRNRILMKLLDDVPLPVSVNDLTWRDADLPSLDNLFSQLEISGLRRRLINVIKTNVQTSSDSDLPGDGDELERQSFELDQTIELKKIDPTKLSEKSGGVFAVESFEDSIIVAKEDSSVFLVEPANDQLIKEFLKTTEYVALDSKQLMHQFGTEFGLPTLDMAIARYLLDPSTGVRQMDISPIASSNVSVSQSLFDNDESKNSTSEALEQSIDNVLNAIQGWQSLQAQLVENNMWELWTEIERPLIPVIVEMEKRGIRVDRRYLLELLQKLSESSNQLKNDIVELAGEQFNVNSTQQLAGILFDKLKLSPKKKTKTGYSTNSRTLEQLLGDHPIIEKIIEYREREKLRSTYAEGLLRFAGSDDRIHATFLQTGTRTGRLSSENPNLQNIPVRTELGKLFRKVFIADEGCELVVADYNQIELRIIAHLSGDAGLMGAFERGEDIHNATASRIFSVDPEEVTSEQRSKAKMVSYGLSYGMAPYGLSSRLNIDIGEATQILDAYFREFGSVKKYMNDVIDEAKTHGYTTTDFGRRRPMADLYSPNSQVRQGAERQAMNAPIQGLAADIFKIALVRVSKRLKEINSAAAIVLQVHDEIIVVCPKKELDNVIHVVTQEMARAAQLKVPLEVNVASGVSWADAKV